MRFILSLVMLLAPHVATAQNADPIAYGCYFCTEPEMRQMAAGLGDGVHYIYDFDNTYITGYTVATVAGRPQATRFEAEDWVKRQFISLAEHFWPSEGVKKYFEDVDLYAPGSDQGMRVTEGQFIRGHHLSALHPQHAQARDTIVRYLERHGNFGFLDTRDSGGRLLQLHVMRERGYPVIAVLALSRSYSGYAYYHFDYALRAWRFAGATDANSSIRIQHSAADFLNGAESVVYSYDSSRRWFADAFADRARWAGVTITGTAPPAGFYPARFYCQSVANGQVACAYY